MGLLEIEAFLTVVKYNNLSAAAKNLFITQPALTRRIQIMEKELGFPLFIRQKGQRQVELTEEGREFYHIAWKWRKLWEETSLISRKDRREVLSIASVDSLNHNMLPDIFSEFIEQGYLLRLYNAFSEDAYEYMEQGIYDLAFITFQDYTRPLPAGIQMHPAYSETFVIVSFCELPGIQGVVDISCLNEEREVYVAWNKEFKAWHASHFNEQLQPLIYLEHAALASYFLKENCWMLAPYSTGERFRRQGMYIYELREEPPHQIIYYLVNGNKKLAAVKHFLRLLHQRLLLMPGGKVQSFLE